MAKRRILSSLGHEPKSGNGHTGVRRPRALDGESEEERQTAIAQARQKNPQAFAPRTREEEQEISKRFKAGETCSASRLHTESRRGSKEL